MKVSGDVLRAVDNRYLSPLVLLDLSAAFDTVNHEILVSRLKSVFRVSDAALSWFVSYMSNRYQSVCINGVVGDRNPLTCGVPQGSVLGPLLFSLYTAPLGKLIQGCDIKYHLYADDTQLYTSCHPMDISKALRNLEICIETISKWMFLNRLKLNQSKTEFIIFGSKPNLQSINHPCLNLENSVVRSSDSVRNLGAIMDKELTMLPQVKAVCRSAMIQIRYLGKIRPYLTTDVTCSLVHSFVTCRLDINNGLLAGLGQNHLNLIQRIFNTAARLIARIKRRDHITPTLKALHWLPIQQRIEYKILLLLKKGHT